MRLIFTKKAGVSALVFAAFLMLSLVVPSLKPANAASSASTQSGTTLHIKIKNGYKARVANGDLSVPGFNTSKLNRKIAGSSKIISSLKKPAGINNLSEQKLSSTGLDRYYEIKLSAGEDAKAVSAEIRKLQFVEEAYPRPKPTPPPNTGSFINLQKHLGSAPEGIGANFASTWPGGKGGSVKIVDVEYSWNTQHEDISDARKFGSRINTGTPSDPFNDFSHGTAVTGLLNGDVNSFGVNGGVPNSKLGIANTFSKEYGWSVATAIVAAADTMSGGDVMLVEQQAWGPNGELMPSEWIPENYDAIKYATSKGIIVVEAAGNDNVNLSDNQYGSSFPQNKANSGAIIVGAGSACTPNEPPLARKSFSNYGSRVDVQGRGECVVTSGYGNLFYGGENAAYTDTFSGTSSASAIVAAAAVSFSSSYKYLNPGVASASLIKSTFKSTGTPQSFAYGSLDGHIGPQPNLAKAIKQTDLKKPTAPSRVAVKLNSHKKPHITWRSSKDNVGVTNYRLYKNGKFYKKLALVNGYTDTHVTKGKKYNYKLRSVDRSGHYSSYSKTVSITVR